MHFMQMYFGGALKLPPLHAPGTNYVIPETSPRILLSNAAVLSNLTAQLNSSDPNATKFRTRVLGEMANPGDPVHPENDPTFYLFANNYAALMFKVTGDRTYGQFAHDRSMTMLASEEALVNAGSPPKSAHDDYYDLTSILGDILLTFDWLVSDGFYTSGEITRIVNFTNTVLTNLWYYQTASWGGVSTPGDGWAINDPANNYYFNFAMTTMFAGLATYNYNIMAQTWLDKMRSEKIGNQLMPYFNTNIPNGGSQEGTGYGTSMRDLFKVYYYWEASTGENLSNMTSHALHTSYWMSHIITPGGQFMAPIGDHARDETAAIYDYQREEMLALCELYPTDIGARVLKGIIEDGGYTQQTNGFNFIYDYIYNQPTLTKLPATNLNTCFYGPDTSVFATRSNWTSSALYVYQMVGQFVQSHAHQDQSSFGLWKGGWLFDDGNLRSSGGIIPHVAIHNQVCFYDSTIADTTPTGSLVSSGDTTPWVGQVVNSSPGVMMALFDNSDFSYTYANIKPVYNNKPQVVTAKRAMLTIKTGCVVIFDKYKSNASTTYRDFGLNTGRTPTISGNTVTVTNANNHTAKVWTVSPTTVSWQIDTFVAKQWDFYETWAKHPPAYRIYERDTTGTDSFFLHVIGVDNDVTSVVANNTGTETGATITFTDGRVAIVRFNNTADTATLDYRTSGNAVIYSQTLPTTVAMPALLSS